MTCVNSEPYRFPTPRISKVSKEKTMNLSKGNTAIKWAVDTGYFSVDTTTGLVYNGVNHGRPGHLTYAKIGKDGYLCKSIKNLAIGGEASIRIHRVVAYAIFGDRVFQPNVVVDHINGDRRDNRQDNLQLISPTANQNNQIKCTNWYLVFQNGEMIAKCKYEDQAHLLAKAVNGVVKQPYFG